MIRSATSAGIVAAALFASLVTAPAMAGFITFDHRENLNLLNSPDVTITTNFATSDSTILLYGEAQNTSASGLGWFSGYFSSALQLSWTIDLGQVRNLETLRLYGRSDSNITAATLETSSDGVNWSGGLSHSTTVTGGATDFVLDTPVDARWLRVTGDTYSYDTLGTRRVGLHNMRLFGSAGTIMADPSLDLVASSAWTGGAATITQNGAGITPPTALADMANDNPASLDSRQLIFNLKDGDSVTVTFGQTVDDIGRVGFTWAKGNDNTTTHFKLLGSTDGINFSTELLDQTGGLVAGPNFFDLSTPFTGKAVRLSIVSTNPVGDYNWLADMFVFQVPEPASLALLSLGIVGVLSGRRQKGGDRL